MAHSREENDLWIMDLLSTSLGLFMPLTQGGTVLGSVENIATCGNGDPLCQAGGNLLTIGTLTFQKIVLTSPLIHLRIMPFGR